MKNNKTNKIPVIRYVVIALIVVLIVGALGTLLIGKTSAPIEDYDTLLSRVNTLQKRVNTLSGVCDVTTSEVSDAIVINGEVRLPSEGLAYAARADGSGYDVIGIGSCKDINVVVPRTYKGLPVIGVSSDFSDPDIESITLYEDVSEISVLTGCDSLRFIYLFSKEPVKVWGNTFEGCSALEGVFVPLGSVDTYKTDESWINSGAADKVVAYETFESTNTLIVNVVGSLQAVDKGLSDAINATNNNLSTAINNFSNMDTNLIAVDTNLQNQINELKPYVTEGMSYEVTTVNEVPGFKLTSANGACNDISDIVIPSTYNGYPVLELGDYCLAGLLDNVQGVIIPESVEKLGAGVFASCSALSRITFLGDVPSKISAEFLMNCPALTEIYVPAEYVDSFKAVFLVYEYMIKPIESFDTLRSDVDAEEAARAEADVNLQNNINNVHNTLNDRITVVDNKIGSVRDVAGEDFIISLLVGNYAEVHLLMAHNGTFKVCSATVFNWGVNVTNLVLTDNQSFSVPVTIDGGVITIHLSQLTVLDSSYSYAGIGKIFVKAA